MATIPLLPSCISDKKTFLGLAALVGVMSSASGVVHVPVSIVSGFNHDVIANGAILDASASTTATFDIQTWVLYEQGFNPGDPAKGLPTNGSLQTTFNSTFQLAPYSGPNGLRLSDAQVSGTLGLEAGIKTDRVGFLASLGNGANDTIATVAYTLTFTGGGTQAGSFILSDWAKPTDSHYVFGSVVKRSDDTFSDFTSGSMSEIEVSVAAEFQELDLVSISFERTSRNLNNNGGPIPVIYAVSVPEPSTYALIFGLMVLAGVFYRRRK